MENTELQIFKDLLNSHTATIDKQFELIIYKLDENKEDVITMNKKVDVNDEQIRLLQLNENNHILNCPQNEKIKEFELFMIKNKNIRHFIYTSIGFFSLLIGAIYTIFKMTIEQK